MALNYYRTIPMGGQYESQRSATPRSGITVTETSVGPQPVNRKAIEIRSPQPPKAQQAPQGLNRRKSATVFRYGSLLTISMLLVAAGWELFRLIIAIITLD
jgi:hypothetical protein